MMKTQGRWMNRTLWCSVVACSLFGYGGLAQAEHQDRDATPGDILTIDHRVPHDSTVPANKGDRVDLFVRERVRGAIVMMESLETSANAYVAIVMMESLERPFSCFMGPVFQYSPAIS